MLLVSHSQDHNTTMKITFITLACIIPIGIMTACNNAQPTLYSSTPEVSQQTTLEATVNVETIVPSTSTKTPPDTIAPPTYTPTAELSEIKSVIEHLDEGEGVTLTSIKMIDNTTGWGVANDGYDDHILRTQDGGGSWQDITPPESVSVGEGIGKRALSFFLDNDHGWSTYYPEEDFLFEPSLIWYTSDGGMSWEESSQLDGSGLETFFEPRELYFQDQHFGWLMLGHDRGVGHAPISIFRTGDGGRNWDRIIDPFSEENSGFIHICCQSGMVFLDSKNGLITSQNGPVESPYVNWTEDGGFTWQEQILPPADEILFSNAWCGTRSPVTRSPQSVALVVECLDARQEPAVNVAFLYTSMDNGQTWDFFRLADPPIENGNWDYVQRSHSIDFISSEIGWVYISDYYQLQGGEDSNTLTHIYNTVDGGKSWQPVKTVTWAGQFSYVDIQNGWAAAFSGDENALVRTTNEGRTWQIITPEIAPDRIRP